jgi:hypothetical protein
MRRKAIIASAICFACLSSPTLGAQDLALFDPADGAGGYTGVIDPLERPVRIAWRPRAGIIGTVETLSTLPGGERETVIITFTGAITDDRNGVNRRFAVSELTANGQHLNATQPLVVVDGWSDPQGGNVSDLEISFPGFIERDIPPPAPGTPQHQLWIDIFAADLAYTDRPIRVGDSIFEEASYRRLLEGQVRAIMGDPDSEIIENTFFARTVGVTRDDGHSAVVAELSGRIEARSGANRILMEARGFGLIDLQSGLSSGTSQTIVTAIRGGREATRTVIVDVRFLN